MFQRHGLVACAVLVTAAALVSACGSAPASAPAQQTPAPTAVPAAATAAPAPTTPAFPITIKDDAGRDVTISAAPKRIVSISASNTEILFALGAEDRIVGVDKYSDYPAAAKAKPDIGGFSNPDLEKVVALQPDLVVAAPIHVKSVIPELERRNLRTIVVDPKDVKGVLNKIAFLGKITGQQQEADSLTSAMQRRIDSVQSRLKGATPVRVFYEISPQLHTTGPGTFVSDVLQTAGGANVAASAGKEWPQLNQEALLLADPEVILLADQPANVTPEAVAARPGWGGISAVKNGRVVVINDALTSRPGPRVVEGIELVAKTLHPDRMK